MVWVKHQRMLLLNLESQDNNKINSPLNLNKKHTKLNKKDYSMMKSFQLRHSLKMVTRLRKSQSLKMMVLERRPLMRDCQN